LWLCLPLIESSQPLSAQSGEPVFQADVTYSFGQLLTFRLTAAHITGVETAILFFQAPEFTSTYISPELVVDQLGDGFQLSHPVELSTVQLAPFTTVTYWWQLQTAGGEEIRLPEESFVYADNQFEWHNLAQGNTTVYWTGEEETLGQIALDVVAEARPHLQDFISAPEDLLLSIYIYPTSADLRAALRLTGRDWVGAHAAPELGVILVTAVNIRTAATDLRQSLPHEMLHFYLYQALKGDYQNVPVWLNEGLATLVEITPRPAYGAVLATAVANQTTIPLAQLCTTLPAGDEQTLLAYAQSLSLLQYIQATYGNQKLRDLLTVYADGADCQSGVERILSLTLTELNQAWLRDLQPRSLLAQFLEQHGLWLLLLLGGIGLTTLLILKNPL
jgi:hypothetical protein